MTIKEMRELLNRYPEDSRMGFTVDGFSYTESVDVIMSDDGTEVVIDIKQ